MSEVVNQAVVGNVTYNIHMNHIEFFFLHVSAHEAFILPDVMSDG